MKRKFSLAMALVIMLNLVVVFMTALPTTIVDAGTSALLNDDFNSYANIAAMQTAGWTIVTPAPTSTSAPVLVTTAAPANLQYLKCNASTSASKTFAPVALTAAGGTSPGINAKLVITYDAYTSGGSGSSQDFWKVDDSTSGNVAVAAGRRAGAGNTIRYAKSIPSDSTALVISSGLTRFTKIKFVVNITDSSGAFLTGGPKVDIYCSDMVTPIAGGSNVNMIDTGTTKVSRFYIGGSYSSIEVDNLNISIQTDAAPTATPTPTPTATPTPFITPYLNDDFNGYANISAMQSAGWQLKTYAPTSTTTPSPTPVTPILVTTAAPAYTQYLRAQGNTSAVRTFRPVPLNEDGGKSPGINAKLIISFDAYTSGGSGGSCDYWKVDDSATGSVAVAAGRRAGQGSYIRYSKSIGSDAFTGITIANSLAKFTKLKFVINITDGYGDYLADGPKVDIYCGDMNTPIAGGSGVGLIDYYTNQVNRFYIGGSYSSIEVDNLEIGLMTNGGNLPPTAVPTPTPSTLFIENTRTVSTFNSMSIYTNYGSANGTAYCNVKYRKTGTTTWIDGQPLWNDTANHEFRGSIVYLDSGTTYDIQLNYGDGTTTGTYQLIGTTWSETFPEGTVTNVSSQNTTLNINQSGTKRAYNVWNGSGSTIDVQRTVDNCIVINASYVIVRNFNVTGSLKNAITINPKCHDVIIEDCNIYNWGPEGPAEDENHVVYYNFTTASAIISGDDATSLGGRRFIIQNNIIGAPAGTANSWDIGHPMGPQGISIMQSMGNNVIRYNEVIGDDTHHFNDAIGGGQNGGSGNVKCDTDIYGNIARYCYDDAMEIEGWNINVRVWNNYTDKSWRTIATAQVNNDLRGPMYVFRNIFGPSGSSGSGTATKLQGTGPLYFYHNMFGLPDNYMGTGIYPTVSNGSIQNVTTRNNIFYIPKSDGGGPISRDWRYDQDNTPNSLDYDHMIYDCRNDYSIDPDDEVHGIFTAPTLNKVGTTLGDTNYYHTSTSNGLDIAYPLPGFNNQYNGAGPDTGACEQGIYTFKAGVQN